MHPETPAEGTPRTPTRRPSPARDLLFQMAAAEGIAFKSTPVIANSHRALELAEFARAHDRFAAVHRGIFAAYFERAQNIGELDVLCEVAEQAGLSAAAARESLSAGRYAADVDQQVEWARENGLTSTPTFVLDDRFVVTGAQEYPLFEQVMQRLQVPRRDVAR